MICSTRTKDFRDHDDLKRLIRHIVNHELTSRIEINEWSVTDQ
jgi:hypothetical protein